jgi:hypothetical protein
MGLKKTNARPGLALGLLMAVIILGGYYALLCERIEPVAILSKVHSLLEEYYWRGFILSQLTRWIPGTLLLSLIAGFIFGIHHIFAMLSLFGWHIVAVCVLGTMAGGFVWSRMRLKGYSIWDCYISHVFADLAIMWVGYDLLLRA